MFDTKMTQAVAAGSRVFDRKIAIGAALGVSVMFAGYAVSAVGTGTTSASGQSISKQSSVVADSIKADAEECAKGTKDGTIGSSIKQALGIHTELAAATPNVESLFDVASDCFSGLSQIYDLSYSIPSIESIIGPATDAVTQYAKKKVCTAVNQVPGLVTSPINQAIDKIDNMSDINGVVQQNMSQIDPDLGAEYHSAPQGGTYTVDTNPYNKNQTDFGGPMGMGRNSINNTPQLPPQINPDVGGLIQSIGNLFD